MLPACCFQVSGVSPWETMIGSTAPSCPHCRNGNALLDFSTAQWSSLVTSKLPPVSLATEFCDGSTLIPQSTAISLWMPDGLVIVSSWRKRPLDTDSERDTFMPPSDLV